MTTRPALAQRLGAWRSFRGIARAARTLAAAQGLRWSAQTKQAARHLAWAQALAEHLGHAHAGDGAVTVGLAIGTDLGLCGRMNAALAEALYASGLVGGPLIIVGQRLVDETRDVDAQITLAAPSTPEAVESLASRIAAALESTTPASQLDLSILLSASTTSDGQPVLERWCDAGPEQPSLPELAEIQQALRNPIADLADPEEARRAVAALRLRARIAHALCAAAASEAAARLFTMSRAYEASDLNIRDQELELRKLQQEAITQDMLEVRSGQRAPQTLARSRPASGQ